MPESPYLVTARKYRPQRFGDLVAQAHVAQALINALKLDRVAHAYLFTGPRGVGKTTAARILAKALNCTGNQNGEVEPCLKCPSCEDFESQRSLCIFEIDAASNNKVEDIRDLREKVRIPPQAGRKKVYIIDEVHMLSNAAFNALLKTLEEPPKHVKFIFATTEPHKVLPTILSRCQRFDFRRIPTNEIVLHLKTICESEGITADEESLHLIAHKGDGALRDALSGFDQAVALCGTELNYSTLADALRVVDVDLYFEATQYITEKATGSILGLADRIISDGYDISEFLGGLAEHVRNLLVTITLGETALVDLSKKLRGRYVEAIKKFTETTLLRILMVIDETQTKLPLSTSSRLTVELALAKMTHLGESIDLSEALEQIRRLEKAEGISPPASASKPPPTVSPQPKPANSVSVNRTPANQPESPQTQRSTKPHRAPVLRGKAALELPKKKSEPPQSSEPSQTPLKDSTELQESWQLVLKVIEQRSDLPAFRILHDAIVLGVRNQFLEIAVRDEMHYSVTKNENLKKFITEAMQSRPELANLQVNFIVNPDVFPSSEIDLDAKFRELKETIPALKQLDEAFALRLIQSPIL